MNITALFSIFSVFIAAPAIVFGFVYIMRRGKDRVEELRLKKEMLELEVEKEKMHLLALTEENRKYDRLIDSRQDSH